MLVEAVRVPLEVLRLFYCRVRKSAVEYSRGRESVNRSLESTTEGVRVPIEVVKALMDSEGVYRRQSNYP